MLKLALPLTYLVHVLSDVRVMFAEYEIIIKFNFVQRNMFWEYLIRWLSVRLQKSPPFTFSNMLFDDSYILLSGGHLTRGKYFLKPYKLTTNNIRTYTKCVLFSHFEYVFADYSSFPNAKIEFSFFTFSPFITK